MVEILETSPDIARALFKGDQSSYWDELASNLNVFGPPVRLPDAWKKVWFDYKCSVKKKLRDNRIEQTATGGGPYRQKNLSDLEERVVKLTNLQATVVPIGRSFGFKKGENNQQNESQELVEPLNPTEQPVHPRQTTKRKRRNTEAILLQNKEMLDLMKQNLESQKELIEETKKSRIVQEESISQSKALQMEIKLLRAALETKGNDKEARSS